MEGAYDEAAADYDQALRHDRNCTPAYCGRARCRYCQGNFAEAVADLNQAAACVRMNNAVIVIDGSSAPAAGPPRRTELPPPAPPTYHNPESDYYVYFLLAWIQATCPEAKYRDGKKAVENAITAYRLNGGKNWDYPSTLAAAYAECGDFDQRANGETKSRDLLGNDKSATEEHKKRLLANLEIYKARKPYRENPHPSTPQP